MWLKLIYDKITFGSLKMFYNLISTLKKIFSFTPVNRDIIDGRNQLKINFMQQKKKKIIFYINEVLVEMTKLKI